MGRTTTQLSGAALTLLWWAGLVVLPLQLLLALARAGGAIGPTFADVNRSVRVLGQVPGMERVDGAFQRGHLVQRLRLGAVRVDAPADLPDVLRRHGARRLLPGEQVGAARDVVPADLQHVL